MDSSLSRGITSHSVLIHRSAQPSDAERTVVILNDFISKFMKTIADMTVRTHGDSGRFESIALIFLKMGER